MIRHVCFVAALALSACVDTRDEADTDTGRSSAAILGGRLSGEDENANVYLETMGAEGLARCSGRMLAPGLVLTVRHCVVHARKIETYCNTDGSPKDIADQTDLQLESPSAITVFIGAHKSAMRAVAVREIVTALEVSICRSDIAFLVLAEPGLDTRTPIRRDPVKIGEAIQISGWGYTSDDRVALPEDRSTLDAVPVIDVGPGFLPQGTFATGGNTMCFGDSGAVALIEGAAVGTYSRIDAPQVCSLALGRNVFTALGSEDALVGRAFAAIGEEPWYAGDRPPWLAPAGAACTADDACRSAVCDLETKTCRPACGSSGVACKSGEQCEATTATCTRAAPTDDAASSCAVVQRGPAASSMGVAAFVFALSLTLRRRGRPRRRR